MVVGQARASSRNGIPNKVYAQVKRDRVKLHPKSGRSEISNWLLAMPPSTWGDNAK